MPPNKRPDALMVSWLPNVRYLTGFTGSNGLLLVTPDGSEFLTDPRYNLQAREEVDCKASALKDRSLFHSAARRLSKRGAMRVAFESSRLSVGSHQLLREKLPGIVWIATEGVVEKLRMVKSADEIEHIRRSVRINSEAFDRAVEHLRPGLSENFFAAEIEFQMRALGAERPSFETIVASGPRSALVHAHPSGDPILNNELLLIDMGAHCEGYASDMTRMVFLGKPGDRVLDHYAAVLEAQMAAIDAVREGVNSTEVDRAARETLAKRGLEKHFVHSTGHGLGLEIHEPPRIARRLNTRLQAGMAITIEPGIYIEGFGGIRIEDTVLVTANGCEVLTPTTKELLTV